MQCKGGFLWCLHILNKVFHLNSCGAFVQFVQSTYGFIHSHQQMALFTQSYPRHDSTSVRIYELFGHFLLLTSESLYQLLIESSCCLPTCGLGLKWEHKPDELVLKDL